MKKKLFILILCATLLLTACGHEAAAPEAVPAETGAPRPEATQAPESESPSALPFDGGPDGAETLSFNDAQAKVRADADAVYLFATNVGKGDALILRVGDRACLIDTGRAWARGRVLRGLALMGIDRLGAVFLTHTDDDHAGGVRWLATEAFGRVENWCASAMFTGVKARKHPMALVAGDGAKWLERGDAIPLGDTGATLKVLAPASLFEDEDDNSLVMMLESPHGKVLLTGDMELPEEAELLSQGDDLSCAVLKVPNHGDDDTASAAFANACAAQVAVISTDGQEKPGTPDPAVVSRLEAAGSRVVVTEDSGLGLLVTLRDGTATVNAVDFGDPVVTGLSIAEVDASDDRITLQNTSDSAVGLAGLYLYSDRGDELFAFPDGATIEPGATLTVGTNSTDGDYDLLWDDKKVISQKKADAIWLYDAWGRIIDTMSNGM